MSVTADLAELERLEAENRRLKRAVEELSVLNDLSREIGASLDAGSVMQTILKRSIKAIGAENGVITLMTDERFVVKRTLVRTSSSSGRHPPLRVNDHLLGWMQLNRRPLALTDPQHDERFSEADWGPDVRSVLCVPLFVRSHIIGVLTLFNKKDVDGFSDDDQRLLAIIASQSAQVIENARLYEEERALLSVQEELRLASQIQVGLLPDTPPHVEGYELAGISIPAQEVGGDYFDYLPFDASRVAICVGDVSGKGLPAAMLMSNVQASLRARYEESSSPSSCLSVMSRLLFRNTHRGAFVTMVYGLIDTSAHTFTYANAGHNRPLLCDPQRNIQRLECAGLVLGAVSGSDYEDGFASLAPGSVLLLYSDGVSEAMNTDRAGYGEERLERALADCSHMRAKEIVDSLYRSVAEFAGEARQHDDMTLVVAKRL